MDKQTIYLNHAGTSWPKPKSVVEATNDVLSLDPAGWSALFRSAHQTVADFFHVDASRLLLTPSCTAALSLAVADHPWQPGDRVVTSRYEHHALYRPLVKLKEQGVELKMLPPGGGSLIDLESLESELKSGHVRLVALTAACNVTGELLPISAAIDLAHEYGALVLVDGAQIAGWWDLDVTRLNVDLFTFAGHKGLQAPWGIGGLYVAPHVSMNCPHATCQIPDAESPARCAPMPGYCDAGSANLAALAGMAAATRWLNKPQRQQRLEHARNLALEFAESIRQLPRLVIHGDVPFERKMPTVAITIENQSSANISKRLAETGLIVSGGFQCAPQAHYSLGTDRHGVIRFSFGPTNESSEVAKAVRLVSRAMEM